MKLIAISLVQCLLLAGGQVLLKFALSAMGTFSWTCAFFGRQLVNWWWLGCGLCYLAATVLWMYILKNFPFSMAYPMISLSYVFGMLAAGLIFHEQIPLTRWLGVALIMGGCVLVAR